MGSISSGTLTPQTDQNFDRGTKDLEYDRERTNPREPDALDDPLDRPIRTRPKTDELDPVDDFNAAPARGTGTGATDMFDSGTDDQINKKPPMSEIQDLPAADPAVDPAVDPVAPGDGKTFLPELKEETQAGSQSRRDSRPKNLAGRSSGFSEVIGSKRLASRSLPAIHRTQPAISFAGRSDGDKGSRNPPVRWISAPMPEGNVRL